MALRRLDNSMWGFESLCFVCERRNEHGLRIPFAHDVDNDTVVAEFSLGETFSGAPRYVHGGVVLAVLDEAMAWATIAVAGKFAVTTETSTTFERPVKVDRQHHVVARVERVEGNAIATSAEVFDERDRRCAAAHATFTVLGDAAAKDAIGTDVSESHGDFLKE